MDHERGENELFDLCSDRRTIKILHETDRKPCSVQDLAEVCDASGPTLYRHINTLLDHDLVEKETKIDSEGNHYTVYTNNIQRATIEIHPATEEVTVDLSHRDSVDQFKRLWKEMKHE